MTPSELIPDRCDRIVNNGMGEPTECGRTLPCEYHAPPASEGTRLSESTPVEEPDQPEAVK